MKETKKEPKTKKSTPANGAEPTAETLEELSNGKGADENE